MTDHDEPHDLEELDDGALAGIAGGGRTFNHVNGASDAVLPVADPASC